MASNAKYNIDVSNIRPAGKPIKGLWAKGTESKYAWKGSTCIYDKVYYELTMNDVDASETVTGPEGFTLNASTYAATNKKTHGNGVVETGLPLNASSITFGTNTSTENTVTKSVTVTQWDGPLNDWVGASVTWTVTQAKDYPVSITLSLGTPGDIPASGGSISSTSWSSTVTFKSGNVVSNLGTISWGTAVTASTLGTTITDRTYKGALSASISYTCNGHTVTASTSVNVYQQANVITNTTYSNFSIVGIAYNGTSYAAATLSPSRNASASQTRKDTYTSGSENSYAVTPSCTWSITSNSTWATVSTATSPSTTVSVTQNTGFAERTATITTSATASTNGATASTTSTFTQEGTPVVVTGIVFTITSAPTLPASGGTVTWPTGFGYSTTAYYNNGTSADVTSVASYSATNAGSNTLTVAASVAGGDCVGTIAMTASYGGYTSASSICIKKEATSESGREVTSLSVTPIAYANCTSGGQTLNPSTYASVVATYKISYTDGTTASTTSDVSSSATYTISSNADWATISSSGSRTSSVVVTQNSNTSSRTATITTSASFGGQSGSATSTFTQEGATAKKTPRIISITYTVD